MSAYEFGTGDYKIKAKTSRQFIDENKVELEGNVSITYADSVVYCDRLIYNTLTKDFTASGKVRILSQSTDFRTNEITGNIETKLIQTSHHQITAGPWFIIGQDAQSFPDESIESKSIRCTTCDIHNGPCWHMTGSTVNYFENGDFEVYNPILHFGGIPVLWLPYMQSDIAGNDGMFKIIPGYDSDWGAFALISTKFKISESVTIEPLLDLYSKKGMGGGVRAEIKTKNSQTNILLYGVHDHNPEEKGQEPEGYYYRFKTEEDRYRLHTNHRSSYFDDRLTLHAKVDKISDYNLMDEFYQSDNTFRHQQSTSYADIEWAEEDYSTSLYYRPQLNDFYSAVERAPEYRFDLPRYELVEDFYVTTQNSIAQLNMNWLETDDNFPATSEISDYNSLRIDSLNMFYFQGKIDNWLNVIPRAGIRFTYYDTSSEEAVSTDELSGLIRASNPLSTPRLTVNNYDDEGDSLFRVLGEVGFEANFKVHNMDHSFSSDYWEIDGLRHIIMPYVNWNWIPNSSEDKDHIYFFDEVDRIDEQNFVRSGIEQRFQTRRNGKIHNLLTVENYVDFHLESEEGDEGIGNFGTKLDWRPFDTFSFNADVLYDLNDDRLNVFRGGMRYKLTESILGSFGYQYRNNYTSRDLYSNGSTLSTSVASNSFATSYQESHTLNARLTYQITPKNLFVGSIRYDVENDEWVDIAMELQHKLHCWTVSVLLAQDYDDQTRMMLMFYLNAYPTAYFGGGG
ncbi:MAG: LPS assembly protein LptD [Lentisphaerales bacterium]|nr:LPS assembly protein LptD [Lentisphaerales bacterium]